MNIYIEASLLILLGMTLLWMVSVKLKNASIVDMFWGLGFVVFTFYLVLQQESFSAREILMAILVTIWGLRLSVYLTLRNYGKGEDFRYQKFREDYGPKRYWWVSFFQVFLLQTVVLVLVASPIAGVFIGADDVGLNLLDYAAVLLWMIGMIFEAGGDYQLSSFIRNRKSRDEVLNKGLWKYTRHPNYFGDAMVWWAYALFAIAAQQYYFVVGSVIMTIFLMRVSGVTLLEKTLTNDKPGYSEYVKATNAFFPWFPKKSV